MPLSKQPQNWWRPNLVRDDSIPAYLFNLTFVQSTAQVPNQKGPGRAMRVLAAQINRSAPLRPKDQTPIYPSSQHACPE